MAFTVLIADDDSGMRLIIRKIIDKFDGFELVGEAEDGDATMRIVEDKSPDVIFLDVEMPKIDGVECAKKILDINPKSVIVFATAHQEYMPEAFELYAFDYITKPFSVERIYKTLRRIKATKDENFLETFSKSSKTNFEFKKLIIKNKEGTSFVDTENIVLIQRENRNTVIYTIDGRYETSESLGHLEDRLDDRYFFRSHRSYIINILRINKIEPYGRWTYIIKFKDYDMDALITSEKYNELEEILLG